MGVWTGPRMFVVGYGLGVTRQPSRPGVAPGPGTADGVGEVMLRVRQQIGAGVDWIKMFGSTGSYEDVTQNQTFTYRRDEGGRRHGARAREAHRDSHLWTGGRARRGSRGRRLDRARDRHGRRHDPGDGAEGHVVRADDRSQSLLRRARRRIRLRAGFGAAAERVRRRGTSRRRARPSRRA